MYRKKHTKLILVLLLFFLFSTCMHGQSLIDSNFIQNFQKKNFVQLYCGLFEREINFSTREKNVSNPKKANLMFSTNASGFMGANFQYKKINFSFDVAIPNTHKVNTKQTDVRALSLFAHHYKTNWGITGFFSQNKGLLMYIPDQNRYADRKDIRMLTTGAHVYFFLNNKKFSYAAANSLTRLQAKSAGSIVLLFTTYFRNINSQKGILEDSISKYHLTGEMKSPMNLKFITLLFRPGYIYNFSFNKGKYFIAPALYLTGGVEWHRYIADNIKRRGWNLNTGYRFKLVTGINQKKYFISLEYVTDRTHSLLYRSKISNLYTEASINFGLRF